MKTKIYLLGCILLLGSCGSDGHKITSIKGEYIPVTTTSKPNKEMASMLDGYRMEMNRIMDEEIAYSDNHMEVGLPESTLTNFTADAMMHLDMKYTKNTKVDMAFMNVMGHRSFIPEGKVTVGNIYQTYAYDNALVSIRIKGKYITKIFESYANRNGAGISGNVKLKIKDGKLITGLLNGKPIDENRSYTIVTLDYLAEGNDGMQALKDREWLVETKMTLRDYALNYVKNETKQGRNLKSKRDGRITVVE